MTRLLQLVKKGDVVKLLQTGLSQNVAENTKEHETVSSLVNSPKNSQFILLL